jgi:hypothetical protein
MGSNPNPLEVLLSLRFKNHPQTSKQEAGNSGIFSNSLGFIPVCSHTLLSWSRREEPAPLPNIAPLNSALQYSIVASMSSGAKVQKLLTLGSYRLTDKWIISHQTDAFIF